MNCFFEKLRSSEILIIKKTENHKKAAKQRHIGISSNVK